MGYGLVAAGGLEAAQQGLRQRIFDQLAQQQQQQQMSIQLREQNLREQEAQRKAEEFKITKAAQAQAAIDAHQGARNTGAAAGLNEIGMGGDVTDQQFNQTFKGTPSEAIVPPLLTLQGRMLSPVPGETSTQPNAPVAQGIHRSLGTAAQQKDATDSAALSALANDQNVSPQMRSYAKVRGILPKGENPPADLFAQPKPTSEPIMRIGTNGTVQRIGDAPPGTHFVNEPQPPANVVIQTDNGAGLVNPRSPNPTVTPIRDASGNQVRPKAGQTMESRLASAKSVLQVGNDMIRELSDPTLAAQLGPVMSRYNSAADFVGNPPPEFSKLAGEIESYALANMGVHGMRSNTGAEAIKATLGQGRHTPASIISTIQGLNTFANHLTENEGRGVTPTQSAADLIKKYSQQQP